ncbi:hypothetical protein [Hyalangium versicolor]|uniref:hypothetical protein n=1 Tax=Hyalangium versicolor TaxID=2861190 RepID=UPI001CCCFA17|nr:hypothetical protein [Hyalangium versicolor]
MPLGTLLVLITTLGGSASADGMHWTNGLSTDDLRFNALSANPRANTRMVEVPLSTATYNLNTGDSVLREQLLDPRARSFFGYLVSCALDASQSVQWNDAQGHSYSWQGGIGLCPEWGQGPASVSCQHWVSACLLARNNAEGKRVLLSGRGAHPTYPEALTPSSTVTTDAYRPYSKTLTASTQPCSSPRQGVHRDCGFQLEHIGSCQPGQPVHLGAGGVPPGRGCGTAPLGQTLAGTSVLRVCEGLHACDDAQALAQSEGTCGTSQPAVSFTCPEEGSFSVMSGARVSNEPAQVVVAAGNSSYPADETEVFSLREGAFFGTLFGPGALAVGVNVRIEAGVLQVNLPLALLTVLYPKMYSCHDSSWGLTSALMSSRLCTQLGLFCVAQPVGACNAWTLAPGYSGPRCVSDNVDGSGGYGACVTPGGTLVSQTITPFLPYGCETSSNLLGCLLSH